MQLLYCRCKYGSNLPPYSPRGHWSYLNYSKINLNRFTGTGLLGCDQRFGGPYCDPADGDSMVLRNVGILQQNCVASQHRRPRLETPVLDVIKIHWIVSVKKRLDRLTNTTSPLCVPFVDILQRARRNVMICFRLPWNPCVYVPRNPVSEAPCSHWTCGVMVWHFRVL